MSIDPNPVCEIRKLLDDSNVDEWVNLKDEVKRPEAESGGESENFNEFLGRPDQD
jgi:hypothetical protein